MANLLPLLQDSIHCITFHQNQLQLFYIPFFLFLHVLSLVIPSIELIYLEFLIHHQIPLFLSTFFFFYLLHKITHSFLLIILIQKIMAKPIYSTIIQIFKVQRVLSAFVLRKSHRKDISRILAWLYKQFFIPEQYKSSVLKKHKHIVRRRWGETD